MRKIVNLSACFASLLIYSVPALACNGADGHRWNPVSKIEQTLGDGDLALTSDQKTQLETIFDAARGTCKDSADKDARKDCFQGMHKDMRAKVDNVLTDAQRNVVHAAREQRKEAWHSRSNQN